ncbi:MAG: RHS repeat-associated core domain-containing protein, partial [Candidatus Hydrogenedentes bacterium]|nr:RHS repeat-associated core domain-containing protein [Candidatus Hydrogenedentota bacterium]
EQFVYVEGEGEGVWIPDVTFPPITYHLDVLGRRIAKQVGETIEEKYLWAGYNTTLLAVYDGSDTLIARFEYGTGRLPVCMTQGSDTYYFTYDQVGSIRGIFNSSGSLVHEIRYDAWGNILFETENIGLCVPFGFAGGLHDRDTDLVRFGFRDYDPETGRWTITDPIGFSGGDIYLYVYCAENPINFFDKNGLLWLDYMPDWFMDMSAGACATLDGIIPFGNPLEYSYANADGTVDIVYRINRSLTAMGRDLFFICGISNVFEFFSSPLAYEVGQATLPSSIYEPLAGLSAIDRGQILLNRFGFWGTIRQTFSRQGIQQFRTTIRTGVTPIFRVLSASLLQIIDQWINNLPPEESDIIPQLPIIPKPECKIK